MDARAQVSFRPWARREADPFFDTRRSQLVVLAAYNMRKIGSKPLGQILAKKLSATQSVPDAVGAYQQCVAQRMQMAAEDRRRLYDDCQKITQTIGDPAKSAFSSRQSGSSTFRLSTTRVSMSLTGSRFSSDSAPSPPLFRRIRVQRYDSTHC
jgi:hypothetical protein